MQRRRENSGPGRDRPTQPREKPSPPKGNEGLRVGKGYQCECMTVLKTDLLRKIFLSEKPRCSRSQILLYFELYNQLNFISILASEASCKTSRIH